MKRGLALASLLLCASPASAAGMFVTPHGARPLGRGGAFVAGADDLNGLYYNPAGVLGRDPDATGWSLLLDGGLILQDVAFTRNENGLRRPTVHADNGVLFGGPLVIPQLALARTTRHAWGSLTLGLGTWIPYTTLPRYPEPSYDTEEGLRAAADVAPQRYALLSLQDGGLDRSTLLAVLNGVVAARLLGERLQLGIGPQLMVVRFRSRMMLSSCTQVTCRPEQVDFDTLVVAEAFALTPSFNLGAIFRPRSWLRLGAAFQFPFLVRSLSGSVTTRLPVNEFFNGAHVEGSQASLALNLPGALRLGVQVEALPDRLEIELAYTLELWSAQRDILFRPRGIAIENVPGVGRYELGEISLPRSLRDTHTVHLGLEWAVLPRLTARAGAMLESSSAPAATLTVLTPDDAKGLLSVGLAVPRLELLGQTWRVDLGYAHVFQGRRTVTPEESRVFPVNPIRPAPDYPQELGGIGAGTYDVRTDVLTLGLALET